MCSFLRALKVDPCLSIVAMFQGRSPNSVALSCNAALMSSWAGRNNMVHGPGLGGGLAAVFHQLTEESYKCVFQFPLCPIPPTHSQTD